MPLYLLIGPHGTYAELISIEALFIEYIGEDHQQAETIIHFKSGDDKSRFEFWYD